MAFDAPYASVAEILSGALDNFIPPERLNTAQYAAEYRYVESGGKLRKFDPSRTPYTVQPSEILDSRLFNTCAIVGPAQVAKTVIAENWLLKSVATDPGDFLWYMQTDAGIEAYVKKVIDPMIEHHKEMSSRLGGRPVDNTLSFKNFGAMRVEFLSGIMRNLINKSVSRIVADEVDNWSLLLPVKTLLDPRRQVAAKLGRSMLLALSHPDMAKGLDPSKDWQAGIMALYADSDRRAWWWTCPECGGTSSPIPTTSRHMSLEYHHEPDVPLDVVQAEAYLLCPCNGCAIRDDQREAMNLAAFNAPWGGWVGLGQELSEGGDLSGELVRSDTAGFWIVGAMSPFVMNGIGGLARERAKAERDLENGGDDAGLRQVIVKQWGLPYSRPRGIGSVEAKDLVDRTDQTLTLGAVPDWVRFVTVAVDCQRGWFEYLFRGWGPRGESCVIVHGKQLGDPSTNPDDWDALLAKVMQPLPLADGSGREMAIRAFGFDMHGEPGVSAQAYAAWARWRREGRVRKIGIVGGREVWTVLPLRGASGINAPKLVVTYPDTGRQSNKKAARGSVPVGTFNPNVFKTDLAGQLQRGEPGDWYVHFPAALKSRQEPHTFFEQLVSERQQVSGRWEKIAAAVRNEALDLMVMTHVMAHLHGLSRINWDKPPAWAAPQDTNSSVSAPATPSARPVLDKTGPDAPGLDLPPKPPEPPARKRSLVSRMR